MAIAKKLAYEARDAYYKKMKNNSDKLSTIEEINVTTDLNLNEKEDEGLRKLTGFDFDNLK